MHKQFDLLPNITAASSRFQAVSGSIDLGDVHTPLDCLQLTDPGDQLCFAIPASALAEHPGQFVLELNELHNRSDVPFAYEILCGSRTVALRTMEPLSSAVCPYFLILDTGDLESGTLCIRNTSGTPVRFSAAYLHSDLAALTEEYLTPMEIGMCFPRLKYDDYDHDLALLQKMGQDTASLKHFTFAAGIEVKYMNLNDAELRQQFQYVLGLAQQAGISLVFNFNSWWDGTPTCRDGKGGYLHDIEYQQVVYNALDGTRSLSVPNIWRNTPWLTMNHPHLNQVRKERLTHTMDILGRSSAQFLADTGAVPAFRIFIDNEPTYWSQFAYCQSPECGGDFNERCIRDARRDGVDLEPKGSLTAPQREWLLKNLSTYISDLSAVYHQCATEEYGVQLGDRIIYGEHHLAENIFTHIFPHSGYPLADDRHHHYEEHVTRHARLGIEAAGFQDDRLLAYASATGRWGQVNAERCCYTDPLFHQQIYTHGAACDIIFNFFYDQDIAHLRQLDKLEDIRFTEPSFGRTVMRYCAYTRDLTGGEIADQTNMETVPLRERWVLRPAQLGQGSITFKVGNTDQYPEGGWLELLCLVRPENGVVSIDAGFSPDALAPLAVLPENDADYQRVPLKVSLDDLLAHPGRDLYIRINMEMRYYDDWAQMNALWDMRTVAAFQRRTESPAGIPLPQRRALSSLLALRQDCQRLCGRFPDAVTPQIQALIHEGACKAAYEKLMHNISVANTHRFVKPGAALEKAPDDTVQVITGTFLAYDPDTGLLRYHTHDAGVSHYQDHLDVPCQAGIPVTITASEIAGDMLDHISTNPYTPAAIVNARIDSPASLSSLNRGDQITLTLEGNTVQKIDAVRGLARGKVEMVQSMSLSASMHNAFLTLEVAPGKLCHFELGMDTRLNYLKAPAPYAALCGESTLGLEIGSIVLVSFEPERVGDRPYRAMEITLV